MNVHKKIIINSKDSIRKKQNAWAWLDEGNISICKHNTIVV